MGGKIIRAHAGKTGTELPKGRPDGVVHKSLVHKFL
jgi:hypothetical protein